MIEASSGHLRVESLNANHFRLLEGSQQAKLLPWLQTMLLRNWIAKAEKHLPGLLPARQPKCLVAIEKNKLVAFIIAKPYNRRGTCWSIGLPELITSSTNSTSRYIKQNLIESALDKKNNQLQSWVFRCPAIDSEQIGIARELGFQPLKALQSWTPPLQSFKEHQRTIEIFLPTELEWLKITRNTARLLFPLEQAGCSGHLRQIVDREWIDLLENNNSGSGVLLNKAGNKSTAIAGLVSRTDSTRSTVLELIRGIAWDHRLPNALETILDKIICISDSPKIDTASEDDQLNQLLEGLGWRRSSEEILLGRSLWRRSSKKALIKGTRRLQSMLGGLQPQQPPLPSPSLGKR